MDSLFSLKMIHHVNYKFEDFQKSEMIKEETIAHDRIYITYAVVRNETLIFLKEEVKPLKTCN